MEETLGHSVTPSPQDAEARIRVLIVDDQALVAEILRRMLVNELDVAVCYCQDPSEAIEKALEFNPTVILQDLNMPEVDGMTLVRYFRAHTQLKSVPLVVLSAEEDATVKAEAFKLGVNDYMVKLPARAEVVARIRHHSEGYLAAQQRDAAEAALREELAEAERYVRRLLPEPSQKLGVDWRLQTSTSLAGDTLDVFPLDDGRLAFYVLDVCGHGVGAALLSIGVMLALRSRALAGADYASPGSVVAALNKAFPSGEDGKYFTIWYGVLDRRTRTLRYAGGGHPPALFLAAAEDGKTVPQELRARGPLIGVFDDAVFKEQEVELPCTGKLYVYSDGVYEVTLEDGSIWPFSQFAEYLASIPEDASRMDALLEHAKYLEGSETLPDDFTILEVVV